MKTIVLGPPGTGKTTTLLNKVDNYLKETCNCDDKRIGRERISVFVVKQFDKKEDDYNQKELKPKDIF